MEFLKVSAPRTIEDPIYYLLNLNFHRLLRKNPVVWQQGPSGLSETIYSCNGYPLTLEVNNDLLEIESRNPNRIQTGPSRALVDITSQMRGSRITMYYRRDLFDWVLLERLEDYMSARVLIGCDRTGARGGRLAGRIGPDLTESVLISVMSNVPLTQEVVVTNELTGYSCSTVIETKYDEYYKVPNELRGYMKTYPMYIPPCLGSRLTVYIPPLPPSKYRAKTKRIIMFSYREVSTYGEGCVPADDEREHPGDFISDE